MIEQFHILNFKCLREIALDLGRITVLVGPNSSGKTSVLEALRLFHRIINDRPSGVFQGSHSPALIRSHNSKGDIRFTGLVANKLGFDFWIGEASRASRVPWQFKFATNLKSIAEEDRRANGDKSAADMFPGLKRLFDDAVLVNLDPPTLAAPSFVGFPEDELAADGAGLASVLATIKATSDSDFRALRQALAVVNPLVRKIEFEKLTEQRHVVDDMAGSITRTFKGFKLALRLTNGARLPANLMSEGTLLVLGLLALLHSPRRPNLVLIDNIERGLHPRAIRDVASMLRRMLVRFPRLQLVLTTHSPYMLDWFEPSEIRLLRLNDKGETICGKLTDHPDYDKWKDEMVPGEFWSMVGEDWLLNGKGKKKAAKSKKAAKA